MTTPISEVRIMLCTMLLMPGIMALFLLAQYLNALAFKKSVMKRLADQPLVHLDVDRQTFYTGVAGFTIGWPSYELVFTRDSMLFFSYLRWGKLRQYFANYGQLYAQGTSVSPVVPKRFFSSIRSATFKGTDLVLTYSVPIGPFELPRIMRLKGIGSSSDIDAVKRVLRIA